MGFRESRLCELFEGERLPFTVAMCAKWVYGGIEGVARAKVSASAGLKVLYDFGCFNREWKPGTGYFYYPGHQWRGHYRYLDHDLMAAEALLVLDYYFGVKEWRSEYQRLRPYKIVPDLMVRCGEKTFLVEVGNTHLLSKKNKPAIYEDLLEAFHDPKHPDYDQLREWLGAELVILAVCEKPYAKAPFVGIALDDGEQIKKALSGLGGQAL